MFRFRLAGALIAGAALLGVAGSAAATPRTLLFSRADTTVAVESVPSDGSQPPSDVGLGVAWGASFSPDGARIAYNLRDQTGLHVVVAAADGSNPRSVTAGDPAAGESFPVRWSPDSRYLYFVRTERFGASVTVWRVGVDGAGLRRVSLAGGVVVDFAISPDGSHMVVAGYMGRKHGGEGVFVEPLPRHGSLLRVAVGRVSGVDWATADEITYTPEFDDPTVHEVHPDGSGDHVLFTLAPGSLLRGATWSPDGSQIAYAAGTDLFHTQLFVANPDGSGAVQLTQTPSYYSHPSWQP